MKLRRPEILMLRKCEAAERFTTVVGEVPDKHNVIRRLERRGLVQFRNGWRLTDDGRKLLAMVTGRRVAQP